MKFTYKARSQDGMQRGSIDADSALHAADKLKEQNLFPVEIIPAAQFSQAQSIHEIKECLSSIGTISLREKKVFFKELETCVSAGISIGRALEYLEAHTLCRPLARKIRLMRLRVDEGISLSRAMAECRAFDKLVCAIAEAGEESGRIDRSLSLIAAQYEFKDNLRSKLLSSAVYPAVVLTFSVIVLAVLINTVLPRFKEAFLRMNTPIPPLTQWVFGLNEKGLAMLLFVLGFLLAVTAGIVLLKRVPRAAIVIDRALLRIPVVGALRLKAATARCMRILGALSEAGIPLLRALELSAGAARSAAVASALMSMHSAAASGSSIAEECSKHKIFRPVVAELISVGEQTGQLDTMFLKLAQWHERDLEESAKRAAALSEPFLILVVGGVVALIVFALFSPVVSAIQSLSAGV